MVPQHILVPIDFSEYSYQALDHAIMLAGKLQARLSLVHVIQALPMGGADMGRPYVYPYATALEEEVARHMETALKDVQDSGLEGDLAIVHGVPAHDIAETAKARKVDLIIMGSHGRTGLQHMLLGSVAERVVRLAPCPVLVVRQGADTSAQ